MTDMFIIYKRLNLFNKLYTFKTIREQLNLDKPLAFS